MKAILMIIFWTTVVGGGLAGFGYFIWLLWEYFESHYEDDVRLSFQDFQRIYSLAPDKWGKDITILFLEESGMGKMVLTAYILKLEFL